MYGLNLASHRKKEGQASNYMFGEPFRDFRKFEDGQEMKRNPFRSLMKNLKSSKKAQQLEIVHLA